MTVSRGSPRRVGLVRMFSDVYELAKNHFVCTSHTQAVYSTLIPTGSPLVISTTVYIVTLSQVRYHSYLTSGLV